MATTAKVNKWVMEHLKNNNYHYQLDDNNKDFIVMMPLRSKFEKTILHIKCDESSITVLAYIEQDVPEKYRANVMELFTRVNYGIFNGSFEIDLDDGEIRYKLTMSVLERESISDGLIGITLAVPGFVLDRYTDALLDVMSGKKTAVEAVNELSDEDVDDCSCGCEHDHDDDYDCDDEDEDDWDDDKEYDNYIKEALAMHHWSGRCYRNSL